MEKCYMLQPNARIILRQKSLNMKVIFKWIDSYNRIKLYQVIVIG